METNKLQRHGLLSLGEVQAFLRDVVGDDELYEIAKWKMGKNELPYKAKDSCRKAWDRYCKEETKNHEKIQDYIDYSFTSHNSISALAFNFFSKLINKYSISSFWTDFLGELVILFYKSNASYNFDRKKKSDRPYFAAECLTNSFSYLNICKALFFVIAQYSDKKGVSSVKEYLSSHLTKLSYRDLFEQLRLELDCKSFERMYEKIGYDFSKREITKCIKTEQSPQWKFVEKILDYCSEDLREKLILKYLLNNAVKSAKENLFVTDEDISEIKTVLLDYCNTGNEKVPTDLLNNLFRKMKQSKGDPLSAHEDKPESPLAMILYKLLYEKNGYKKQNADPLKLIESMKSQTPVIAPFFVPWFKAIYYVAKRDFSKPKIEDESLSEATRLFDEAFEYKYLAGDFIKEYLEMGFALENYVTSNFSVTTKFYNNEGGVKNPISCDAKKFLNFGFAINLFPEPADKASEKALNANDLFYKFFPLSLFFDEEGAKKKRKDEIKNDNITEIDEKHVYEKLSKLSTSKRNDLIFIKEVLSDDKNHNSKQKKLYPPLSLCLHYCLQDERLLDLAEEWLADESIITTKVSYAGQTPLCEAFKVYKYARLNIVNKNFTKQILHPIFDRISYAENTFDNFLNEKKNKEFKEMLEKGDKLQKRLENILSILIEKTSYYSELQFGHQISTLTYAIDAFNFDFVKKIADKIPDEEFQDYRLYGSISPLMYAIHRKQPVSMGFEEFIRITKDINIPKKLDSHSLNFTREEDYQDYDFYNPLPKDIDAYWYHHDQKEKEINEEDFQWYQYHYGNPEHSEIQDWQVRELDKIIDYFISRTKDIDSIRICSSTADGDLQINTALIYSAQHNDVDTCRKLIKKNADIFSDEFGQYIFKFGENHCTARNDLINNLCIYKSWETLIMIFDEYPDLIIESLIVNEGNEINSFTLFATVIKHRFIWAGREKIQYKDIAEYLIKRFLDAGANPDAKSPIGSVREILSGTHLLEIC